MPYRCIKRKNLGWKAITVMSITTMELKVSVIIPVYNVFPYLSEAIESVIFQTYRNLEIILVDDGSTDGSEKLCDEYSRRDNRIKVVHQTNKGLSTARNVGLDLMTGDVVAFLDSDDAYDKTYIEKLLTAMVCENADLVICKFTSHKTDGKLFLNGEQALPIGTAGNYDRVHSLRALANGTINVSVWNKLYRKKLWHEIRYPDGHVYEDIDTSFRVFDLCNTISVLDEPLYFHRIRAESITDTFSLKNVKDRNLATSHFASFMESHIPEMFSQAQVRKWRQSTLAEMIAYYIVCDKRKDNTSDSIRKRFREQIITIGKEAGIDTLGLRARVAWYMMCVCPGLLTFVYSVYHPVRQLIYKSEGK